jgi:hypothetical protein
MSIKSLMVASAALFIVACTPIDAQAGHHRGHALGFITTVEFRLLVARSNLDALEAANPGMDPVDVALINSYRQYGNGLELQVLAAKALLEGGGDLDVARRLITQPNGTGPISAVTQAYAMTGHLRNLGKNYGSNNYLVQAASSHNILWNSLDRVVWHITDAIREEVYNDPLFQ